MRDVRTVRCRGKRLRHFDGIVPSLACMSAVEIPLENLWKCHFRDLFQNVPRCLGPQELVPLVRVPKPPTHYQPAT